VPRRRLWIALLGVLAGGVLVHAQGLAPTTSTAPATTTPATSTPAPTTPTSETELEKRIYAPEVWRLPPVGEASPFAQPPPELFPAPAVLMVPPAELIPPPPPDNKPPVANAPASLSGVLSDGERIEIKPESTKLWDGSFNLGLDGSEGNTVATNFRFGFNAVRKTELSVVTLNLDYKKQTSNNDPTADRLYFEGRCERLLAKSRWSLFVHETIEYDEFQPFNVRDTSDAGVGYRLIKTDLTTLIGRFGGGFSHEYGGPENGQYFPEAVFGLQMDCQLTKRQKLVGVVEYAPDVGDFLRYRIRTQAALEISLDQEKNLSLRMGVLERYNSVPNGALPNDLDYALMLMWKF
jgi:putative salt-induced outer membrane protein YdiY